MKRILVGLLLALPMLTFAQSNFLPGYVITKTKDSLSGYIDRKDWSITPSTVNFKPTLAGNIRTFSKTDCIAFGINGQESYQQFVIDISQSSADVNALSVGPDNSSKKDTVFLNVLQAGKNVTLYEYRDALKTRFYIKERNSQQPVELIQQQYFRDLNSKDVVNDNKYAGQLLALMTKYKTVLPDDESNVKRSRYFKTDMIKIVSVINDQQSKETKSSLRLYAGIGLNINKVDYLDKSFANVSSKPSYLPMFSIGVDLTPNPVTGRSVFRLDLSYAKSKTEATTTTTDPGRSQIIHAYDEGTFSVTPQFIYNIYNTSKFKAYAGAGIGVNFSNYDITSTEFNSVSNSASIAKRKELYNSVLYALKAGVVINKMIELTAGYTVPYTGLISAQNDYDLYKIHVQRFSIGLNYQFGKK